MSSIFISYSRKDLAVAEKIVSALAESKLDTWIDWESIPKGEKFEKEIYQGIEGANIFLFLISPESVQSEWCKKEVVHATVNNKRIIPILIQDTDKDTIPLGISEINWVDCRDGQKNFSVAIAEILNTIHTDYEWVKDHTKLQVKALEWERRKDNSRLLRGKELQEAEQQLAISSSKDPQPTDTQRQYILASRKDETRRQRQTTTGVTVGFIVVSVFCIAAVVASIVAAIQRNIAVSNENARATAQAIAEEQANIALARQLAAQAQLLFNKQDNSPLVATLLAIESKQRFPNAEADEVIRNSLNLLLPLYTQIPTSHSKEITSVVFSPDGNFIASGSSDNTARIWDTNSGEEITLFQISGQVTDVRFSPDSKLFYVKSDDGYIRSWSIESGTQILEAYHGEDTPMFDLSADGKIAVSSGMDGIVLIWNAETGREITGANHNNNTPVSFVAISLDGTKIASVGGEDNIVKIWDSQNGRLISQKNTDSTPWAVAFSPDSQKIISNNGAYSEIWNVNTGEMLTKINANSVFVYLFSPTGKFIATLGVNGRGVDIWDTETGELVNSLSHEFFVFSIAFSPGGKYLASGSEDGVIKLWDIESGQEVRRIVKSGTVNFAFSPNSDLIASPTNKEIYLWRISNFASTSGEKFKLPSNADKLNTKIDPTGEWIASWNQNEKTATISDVSTNTIKGQIIHNSSITILNFSSNGSMLITGDESGNICIWKMPTGEKTTCFFQQGSTNFVTISPDLNLAAAVQNSGLATEYHLTVWNIQKGERALEVTPGFLVNNVTFSNDNKFIAIAGMSSYISIWDITSQKEMGRFQDYYSPLTTTNNDALVFISNGRWLITNGREGARAWDLSNLIEISRITYDQDEFFNLDTVLKTVESPDQTKLASVNTVTHRNLTFDAETKRESTIRIWDPTTGKETIRMVHNSWVNDIVWSPDGKYVLSGGQDGIVRIWDANNGNEVGTIVHDAPIKHLQFTPNDEQIISISDDGIYQISYLRVDDIITQICSYVTRNLNLSEWKQYFGDIAYHATCPNLPTPTN